MDKRRSQRPLDRSSMQAHRAPPFELLLRTNHSEPLRSLAHETSRRDLHGVALLRLSEDFAGASEGRGTESIANGFRG